uniref:Transcription elongation factor n=1 Tax=Panagrellus redivivus TaxID=6233 RepID=A0A7E4UNI4_PANRE
MRKANEGGATEDPEVIIKALEAKKWSVEEIANTRAAVITNEFRKKITDEKLAKRYKGLIKLWKTMPESPGTVSAGSRKTKSTTSPGPEGDAKKSKPSPPNEVKTVKTEKPSTSNRAPIPPPRKFDLKMPSDETRSRNVTVLATSLKSAALPDGSQHPDDLAIHIEYAIYEVFNDTSKEYMAAIRSRVFNLRDKKNPALRENILTGQLAPERFARMTADEMASDEMKNLREAFTKEGINEHQMAVTEGTPTDMFKCGKCHQNNCTYNQLQTRSADEPMTTFVFCRSCGNRWKFC